MRMASPFNMTTLPENACYDIAGWRLNVGADTPDLLQSAHELFGPYRCRRDTIRFAACEDDWSVILRRGDIDAKVLPPGCDLLWSGEVSPSVLGRNYAGPSFRRFDLADRGTCEFDLQGRSVQVTIVDSVDARSAQYFLMAVLCIGLSRAGSVPVHASCLAARRGGKPCSVVIVAPSGTGKSTTSFGLTSGGWKLMGDDLALVRQEKGGTYAWGYPRRCHVRRPTLALLPWLKDLPLTPLVHEDAWQFPLHALGERAVESGPMPLPAGLVVLLEKPNPQGHRCEGADPATALAWICRENVQAVEGYADPDARQAFVTLAQWVRTTPAVRVSVGPDPESLAAFLEVKTGVTA